MKKLLLLLLLSASFAFAQTAAPSDPENIYAAGFSFNQGSAPQLAGTGLYAHKVADSGTYAFTAIDVLPVGFKPFQVTSNVSAGIGQKVFTFHNIPVYSSGTAGVSFTGNNLGWAWTTGVLASVNVKGQKFLVGGRALKTNIGNGAGVQPILSVLYRF